MSQSFEFYKYQACGNDFVLLDLLGSHQEAGQEENRLKWIEDERTMALVCDRRFGIGADGVLVLGPAVDQKMETAFRLYYLNADGRMGSLCGNGARCAASHAFSKGYAVDLARFDTGYGLHQAWTENGVVRLAMQDPRGWNVLDMGTFVDTGSPHLVVSVQNLVNYPVLREGKALREHAFFGSGGTNVNFMETIDAGKVKVRTYERGVENETLSCGTGAVACALVHLQQYSDDFWAPEFQVQVQFRGGSLLVTGTWEGGSFRNLHLSGPTCCTYKGYWPGLAKASYLW